MSAASAVRFAPGPFRHNGRVAAALLPALLVAAGLGGRGVAAVFTVGTMLWYIMDALQYREGAFSVGWGTLALAQAGISLNLLASAGARPLPLTLLLLLSCGALLAVAGMWLTLQFRFVQMHYPAVVLAFERQVVTAALPVSSVMLAVGLAAVADLGDVPYYLAALLCLLYQLLARPLESSFHQQLKAPRMGGGSGAPEAVIQSKVDAFWLALAVLLVPGASYLAIHASVIAHWLHAWSLMILGCAPLLYISALPDGLWWLPMPARYVRGVSRLVTVLAAFGLLAGFEGRVVFHAFMPFIKLPPPWNYLLVSGALLGLVCLALAHVTGAVGTSMDVTVAGCCLLLCTTAGSLVVGVPLPWLPAPLLAACGLALFYDSRSLREYAVFVAGAFLSAAWFVHTHFWFLDLRVGFVHLHTICKLALAALLPSLLVPGLVLTHASRAAVGVLMLVQAELLALLEEQMYAAHHHEDAGAEPFYPAWLVLATSAAGVAACQALYNLWALPRWAAWVVSGLYAAKLSMLVLPEAYLVLPTALLLLAAGAPLYCYGQPEPGKRRARLAPWQALAHVGAVLAALALARFAVFDVIQFAVLGKPHEGVLLGGLLVVAAAALAPLVLTCYAHNQAAVRLLVMLGVSGTLLAMLQPPLPRVGGAACPQLPFALCPRLWDERHVPMHDADDVAIWGSGLGRREHWPRWLLVAAATGGLLGLSGAVPGSRTPLVRLAVGAGVGWLVGEYLALELVPGQWSLQALVIGSSLLAAAAITLLQNPLLGSRAWLPLLAAAWAGVLVFTLVLQASLPLPDIQRFRRLYPDSAARVENERREAVQASLLGVFAAQSLLLAFALKLKTSAAARQQGPGRQPAAGAPGREPFFKAVASADLLCGVAPAAMLASLGKALHLDGPAGAALRRLQREGLGWVPLLGNAATLLAFGIAVHLNLYLTGGVAPEGPGGRGGDSAELGPAGALQPGSSGPTAPSLQQAALRARRCVLPAGCLRPRLTPLPLPHPLDSVLAGGAPEALLMLAPMLLLLSQDALLLRGLGEGQRYLPPLLAFSGYLAASSAVQLATWALEFGDWGAAALNAALMALALPLHALFARHLWSQPPQPTALLAGCGALSLVSLFLSQSEPIRWLAGSGLAMGGLQFFSVAHVRRAGMKVV